MLTRISWIATAVGAVLGLLQLLSTFGSATGAPQQAAGAAMAAALAVIPYVFARALENIVAKKNS